MCAGRHGAAWGQPPAAAGVGVRGACGAECLPGGACDVAASPALGPCRLCALSEPNEEHRAARYLEAHGLAQGAVVELEALLQRVQGFLPLQDVSVGPGQGPSCVGGLGSPGGPASGAAAGGWAEHDSAL